MRPRTSADAAARGRMAEVRRLHHSGAEQRGRIRELEARLALSQAEARDLREELQEPSGAALAQTVRIGTPEDDEEGWQEPEPESDAAWEAPLDGPRLALRLYGTRPDPSSQPAAPLALAHARPGLQTQIQVAPLPGDLRGGATAIGVPPPVAGSSAPGAGGAVPRPGDEVVRAYREALSMLSARHYAEALLALDRFLAGHGSHPYAANAMYWRGEVLYAQRKYGPALSSFERVVHRWPTATKVADALLKIALCHLHMGDSGQARSYFRRVQRQFPESVAARLASQEDAS